MDRTGLERRMTSLEHRTREVEHGHDKSIYKVEHEVRGLRIDSRRLIHHANTVGRSLNLIMAHLGIPPEQFEEIAPATAAEIDASFDEEC